MVPGPGPAGPRALSPLRREAGEARDPGAAWSPDSRGHRREGRPGPAGSEAGADPPHSCGFTPAAAEPRRGPLGAARRRPSLPSPPVVRPEPPLPARRVARPVPLPATTRPYIRCPPALGSAATAAAAMLSRSRCVSRAFSRSLSAFQKVRSGRAGAAAGEKPVGRWTGCLGAEAGRAGQAGHQGHRDAEAAGWGAQGRC